VKLAEGLLAKRKAEIFDRKARPDSRRRDLTVQGLSDLWFDRPETLKKKSLSDDRIRLRGVM
jgi:hypothetical protein